MLVNLLFITSYCGNRAILIDGSSNWINYRFEADIWSIYQKLIKNGFETKDIIIACYDDIADNPNNSYKGQIFNDLDHHQNVYGGKDALNYKNKITSKNIYDLLMNLDKTENDNLFIYYESHGIPGYLFVPNQDEGLVSLISLTEILIDLSIKKKFKNCLLIIEACYSGLIGIFYEQYSLIYNVKNIAIITSATSKQTSVSNKYDDWIGNYISTLFSSNFQDKIKMDPDCTVNEIFGYLSSNSKGSDPTYTGSEDIKNMKISDFIGKEKIPENTSNSLYKKLQSKKTLDLNANVQTNMMLMNKKVHKSKINLMVDKIKNTIMPFNQKQNKKDFIKAMKDYSDIVKHIHKKVGQIPENDCDQFLQIYEISMFVEKKRIIEIIDNFL